jgi:glycosyltransferase involved in cell wall biosynthesis
MKKKVLVDLTILKHPNCGLGQIALNYGRYFRETITGEEDFVIYLLVPKGYIGAFGMKVKYIQNMKWFELFPFLLPKFDVWHAIHQLVKFRPYSINTKYLFTIHDFNFMYEKSPQKASKYLASIQKKIDRADYITAISNFAKGEVMKYANVHRKTVEVVLNGVESLYKKPSKQPEFIDPNYKSFFFTIGQVQEKKNFHTLVEMMKFFPEKKLYIVGFKDTDYAKRIQAMILEHEIKNICLPGTVSNEERVWLYSQCEAFLFPSLFEGFGLPIIEALSFGKPVFSSKETSLKEIGSDFVYYWDNFEPLHMKEIVEAGVGDFNQEPKRAKRNMEYASGFTYERNVKSYIRIYQELLNH